MNSVQATNHKPDTHPMVKIGKLGVLLVNLGTPDNCDTASVRRYLAEFLSDRRVIELTPWIWQLILHGIILRTRPSKVAKAYQQIWLKDPAESPLMRYTRQQAQQLQQQFTTDYPQVIVEWGMRYGNPAQGKVMEALQQQGCDRILIVPLYPQYSAATTASVMDAVNRSLGKMRWQPSIRVLPPYYAESAYIEALAQSVEDQLKTCTKVPEVILASFHGLPQSYLDDGDPYYCHCVKTTRLLRQRLQMDESQLPMAFQSRFGPKEWLKPYANITIENLAKQGIKHIAVITPGFAADCLETIEEMGMQNQQVFFDHGGEVYDMIPCLNDSDTSIKMLHQLVKQELAGWL